MYIIWTAPGSSGSPLMNERGEVVGLVSAISTLTWPRMNHPQVGVVTAPSNITFGPTLEQIQFSVDDDPVDLSLSALREGATWRALSPQECLLDPMDLSLVLVGAARLSFEQYIEEPEVNLRAYGLEQPEVRVELRSASGATSGRSAGRGGDATPPGRPAPKSCGARGAARGARACWTAWGSDITRAPGRAPAERDSGWRLRSEAHRDCPPNSTVHGKLRLRR